jgi:hypothetical protein
MSEPRPIRERFPPPWRIEEISAGLRIVDRGGRPLAYVYVPDESVRAAIPGASLTRAEALSLCNAIARLPDILGPSRSPE